MTDLISERTTGNGREGQSLVEVEEGEAVVYIHRGDHLGLPSRIRKEVRGFELRG